MNIKQNLEEVQGRILRACERAARPSNAVTLVAITKTHDAATIRKAFEAGIRHFGENRVQEAAEKLAELEDLKQKCTWHMVGHLQTNKVKTAVRLFDIIQSVDSVKLAGILDRNAAVPLPIFLEVNVAQENTKSGFNIDELDQAAREIRSMPNLLIRGLMTVAPWASNPEEVRPVFRRLRELGEKLALTELSMGMTDDFEVAIEEGATVVRVGRAIFGERGCKI